MRNGTRGALLLPMAVMVATCTDARLPSEHTGPSPDVATVLELAAPQLQTLVDDFAGSVVDEDRWLPYGSPELLVQDDRLEVMPVAEEADFAGLRYRSPGSLTAGSSFTVEVSQVAGGSNATETYVGLINEIEDEFAIITSIGGSLLVLYKTKTGPIRQLGSAIAYNPTNHRFRRILRQGNNLRFQVSANGTSWSMPAGWQVGNVFSNQNDVYGNIGVRTRDASNTDPSPAFFENVNTTVPAIPRDLNAHAETPTRVVLGWQDRSVNESGFRIERRIGEGEFEEIAVAGANATAFLDDGLTPGTTYGYRVRAFNSNGPSGYTNVAEVTTPAPEPQPPTADAGGPYSGDEGAPITFDGTGSSDPEGGPLTFSWSFGDGATGNGAAPTHTYADDGTYTVVLVVTDTAGVSSSPDSTTVTVANVAPTVTLEASATTIQIGEEVTVAGGFSDPGVNDAPWAWELDWGDGTTQDGTVEEQGEAVATGHSYAEPGSYTVTLSVTDADGGTGSASVVITVQSPENQPPTAEAGGPYSGDEGGPITFDGTGSSDPEGGPLTFSWSFGDGALGSGATPTHTYADDGTYTVVLVVTDEQGLSSAPDSTTVTVANVAPAVTLGLSASSVPLGTPVTLTGNFSDPGVLDGPWQWRIEWGDGTVETGSLDQQGVAVVRSHTYGQAGGFTVRFEVTDKDGGTGGASQSVTVAAAPPPGPPLHTLVDDFAGATVDPTKWAFYDEPSRTAQDDRLIVTLTPGVAGYGGVISALAHRFDETHFLVEISQVAPGGPLTETFMGVTTLDEDEYVVMSSLNGWLGGYYKWAGQDWVTIGIIQLNQNQHRFRRIRIANGTVFYETSPNGLSNWTTRWTVAHQFTNLNNLYGATGAGAYVADPNAGTAIIENVNTTVPAIPSNLTATLATPTSIALAWQDRSVNETGFRVERRVDGGGFQQIASEGQNTTSHLDENLQPGTTYEYRVRAVNGSGFSGYTNIAGATTPSENQPPVADAGGPYTGSEGGPIGFDGTGSSDPEGGALSFAWSFGDGADGTGATPTHTYADDGTYTVVLVVTDPQGLSSAPDTTTVTVANVAPSVTLSLDQATIPIGGSVTATGGFSDPGANDAPWQWEIEWGDGGTDNGSTSDQAAPITRSRTYEAPGDYTVRLQVTDKDGGVGAATAQLTVLPAENQPPVAHAGGPYAGDEGAAVTFDGSGSSDPEGGPLTFAWSFGDGASGTGVAPSHSYADDGMYVVVLVVTDAQGLSSAPDSTTVTIANVAPLVALTLNAATAELGQPVTATGGFTDPGVDDAPWQWEIDWGDGTTENGSTTDQGAPIARSHTYAELGEYTIRLQVTDKDGGIGSATQTFGVLPPPPPPPPPPMHSLTDDFAGTEIDVVKWLPYGATDWMTQDNRLELLPAASVASFAGLRYRDAHAHVGSWFGAEISQVAGGSPATETFIGVITEVEDEFAIITSLGGTLRVLYKTQTGSLAQLGSAITFNPNNHRFRRVLRDGNMLRFQVSANGSSWSTPSGWSIANFFVDPERLYGNIGVRTRDASNGNPTPAFVENVNLWVPASPRQLTATPQSSSSIALSWQDRSSNEQGFRVERSTDGGAFQQIAQLGANATAFTDTNLTAGTTYRYRVRAYNANGNSAYSNIAEATTP